MATSPPFGPATVLPDAAVVGALDDYLQAFAMEDGRRIWKFDTVQDFDTVNGVPGHGGAMSAAGAVVTRNSPDLDTHHFDHPTWTLIISRPSSSNRARRKRYREGGSKRPERQ